MSREELDALLRRAGEFKRMIQAMEDISALKKRIVALLFEKPSTRTRTSFEAATIRLGGEPLYLSANELQLSRGEPIKDTARILGGYVNAIVGRVYSHDTLVQLKEYSGVPVINGLSDLEHPTQIVSDLFTIIEAKGRLKGLNFAYIGDGDNVCNSLLLGATMVRMNITVACPSGYLPNPDILRRAEDTSKASGSSVRIVNDPKEAARGADVLYTDVWVSMGEEKERNRRIHAFRGFQINSGLLEVAAKDAVVMHCLPAHRDMEITNEVIEGKQSIVWRQGENKLYGAAAVLDFAINGERR